MRFDCVIGMDRLRPDVIREFRAVNGLVRSHYKTQEEEIYIIARYQDWQITPAHEAPDGDGVLYEVHVGDFVVVNRRFRGTTYQDIYHVERVTDNVIYAISAQY